MPRSTEMQLDRVVQNSNDRNGNIDIALTETHKQLIRLQSAELRLGFVDRDWIQKRATIQHFQHNTETRMLNLIY